MSLIRPGSFLDRAFGSTQSRSLPPETVMGPWGTHGIPPRSISFKGTIQTLEPFQPLVESTATRHATDRRQVYQQLIDAVATHRVADRPDRFEPRAKKKRRDHYAWLTSPRHVLKRQMAKGFITS